MKKPSEILPLPVWCLLVTILFSISGCAMSVSTTDDNKDQGIQGQVWHLKPSITGLQSTTETTLQFDDKGSVQGFAMINRYHGSVILEQDGSLNWQRMISSTRKAGPPELMNLEAKYFQQLRSMTHWQHKGDQLILSNGSGDSLTFSK